MKIPKSKAQIVIMFFMVVTMTFVVVFVTTAFNYCFQSDFVFKWLKGWGLAFIIAFPTVLIIMPFIRKFVASITEE